MTRGAKLDWPLGPIAHRGLHDVSDGRLENSPAAIAAAREAGFGIEVDIQLTRDGKAIVFHDFSLERLTSAHGRVRDHTRADMERLVYLVGGERPIRFQALLDLVDGAVPLYVELKSDFSGELGLADALRPGLEGYDGPIALMSFDPALVRRCAALYPRVPAGIVSGRYATPDWDPHVPALRDRLRLRHLIDAFIARPAFVNYEITSLAAIAPQLLRRAGVPLLTWTVRTVDERAAAAALADAMVFEGFVPDQPEGGTDDDA
ncbi:MAG: glycerophosphodiester phosphodiesterase family protein [Pseudomonadota bacterium]